MAVSGSYVYQYRVGLPITIKVECMYSFTQAAWFLSKHIQKGNPTLNH